MNRRHVIFVVGAHGLGKTTAVKAIGDALKIPETHRIPEIFRQLCEGMGIERVEELSPPIRRKIDETLFERMKNLEAMFGSPGAHLEYDVIFDRGLVDNIAAYCDRGALHRQAYEWLAGYASDPTKYVFVWIRPTPAKIANYKSDGFRHLEATGVEIADERIKPFMNYIQELGCRVIEIHDEMPGEIVRKVIEEMNIDSSQTEPHT